MIALLRADVLFSTVHSCLRLIANAAQVQWVSSLRRWVHLYVRLCCMCWNAKVDLCGHATLASAHVLRSLGVVAPTQQVVRFLSKSGPLVATYEGAWSRHYLTVLCTLACTPHKLTNTFSRLSRVLPLEPSSTDIAVLQRGMHGMPRSLCAHSSHTGLPCSASVPWLLQVTASR